MHSKRVQVLIALLAILVLGGALRFYGITEQGLLLWDEGGYLCEALFLFNGLHDLDSLVTGQANGMLPYSGRTTHVALIALMMGLVGSQDYAGLLVSALLGTCCILVVFELARRMFGVGPALISSLTLAVMPYHVMYSRQALAEADSTFFFYLGVLLYYRSLTSRGRAGGLAPLAVGGLFLGVAATCNLRWYPLLAAPCLLDLAVCGASLLRSGVRLSPPRRGPSPGWVGDAAMCLARQAVLVGASIAPALLWEAAFHALGWYARATNLGQPIVMTLFQQLRSLSHAHSPLVLNLTDPAFYVHALWEYAGPAVFLLCLAGIIVLGTDRTKRVEGSILLIGMVAPMVYFSLFIVGFRAPRVISIVLPAASLLVARAVQVIHGRAEKVLLPPAAHCTAKATSISGSLLPSLILVSGLVGSWPMLGVKSGNTQAGLFLQQHGVDRYLISTPIVAFYAPSFRDIKLIPYQELDLLPLYDEGYRYVAIDEQAYFCRSAGLFSQDLLAKIEAELEPVYIASDTHKLYPQFFLEQDPCDTSFQERMQLFRKLRDDRGPPEVRVYELPEDFVWSLLRPCIDIRTEQGAAQLLDGWYDVEQDGSTRWRWMANEGSLLLGVEGGKGRLEIEGHAVTEHFQEDRVLLQVFVNDQLIGAQWLGEGDFFSAFDIPKGVSEQDRFVKITLRVSDAFIPDGELRELGVIIHSICFR